MTRKAFEISMKEMEKLLSEQEQVLKTRRAQRNYQITRALQMIDNIRDRRESVKFDSPTEVEEEKKEDLSSPICPNALEVFEEAYGPDVALEETEAQIEKLEKVKEVFTDL